MTNDGFRVRSSRGAFIASCVSASVASALPKGAMAAGPVTAQQAIDRLMAGNKRFVAGTLTHQDALVERRVVLAGGQSPFAAILTCADSRTSPELMFDEGVGDLFVCRVAGNFPTDAITASFEFALSVLGARLIMVVGHESCGAIKAVYDALKTDKPLPPHLNALQQGIGPNITQAVGEGAGYERASMANVGASIDQLRHSSPVIGPMVTDGSVRVVGGYYHLASGQITTIE